MSVDESDDKDIFQNGFHDRAAVANYAEGRSVDQHIRTLSPNRARERR
jgi:hypothetical protein